MTRIFPPDITPSDIASMLALLDAATPYLDKERGWAYFELGDPKTSPFASIFVALNDYTTASSARRAAAEAITLLPRLHACVVGHKNEPGEICDVCALSHLDVSLGEIDVCYTPSVNATWRNTFRKDEAGRWRALGDDSSVDAATSCRDPRFQRDGFAEQRQAYPDAAADRRGMTTFKDMQL